MALLDVYEVSVLGNFNGRPCNNVFFYQNTTIVAPPSNVASYVNDKFIAQVLPLIRGIANPNVNYTAIKTRNLFNDADANTRTIALTGTYAIGAQDREATFYSFSVGLNTSGGAVKNGRKGFGGQVESSWADGILSNPTYVTAFTPLLAQLKKSLQDGTLILIDFMKPVIVKRIKELVDGKYQYRLPNTILEATTDDIINVVPSVRASTQNSRK